MGMDGLTLEQVKQAGLTATWESRFIAGGPTFTYRPWAGPGELFSMVNGPKLQRYIDDREAQDLPVAGSIPLPLDGWRHVVGCDCEFCRG